MKKVAKQTNEQKLKAKLKEMTRLKVYWQDRFNKLDDTNDDLRLQNIQLEETVKSREVEMKRSLEVKIQALRDHNEALTEILRWQINPDSALLSEQEKQNRQEQLRYRGPF